MAAFSVPHERTVPLGIHPVLPGSQVDESRMAVKRRTGVRSELDDIDALVRNHRPRLLRFVLFSVKDMDLAESITQDTFLKAYEARERFRGDCSIGTWLTSIALNLIRDHHRVQKFKFWKRAQTTAIDISGAATFLPSGETSALSRLIAKEKVQKLIGALDMLTENQRAVFLLRFSDEMSIAEISAALDMHVNTVKTHLHRALKAVRARLGES